MIITELKGNSQVLTQKDGKTFRIFAHETKKINENLVSEEMRIAEEMGLILMSPTKNKVVTEEVTTKKTGGKK